MCATTVGLFGLARTGVFEAFSYILFHLLNFNRNNLRFVFIEKVLFRLFTLNSKR